MSAPPFPYLSWSLIVDDHKNTWYLEPRGHSVVGAIMYALLLIIPIITAVAAVLIFKWSFYGIRHNQWGMKPTTEQSYFPILGGVFGAKKGGEATPMAEKFFGGHKGNGQIIGWPEDTNKRRKVLIATLEYEIIDWKLKVK